MDLPKYTVKSLTRFKENSYQYKFQDAERKRLFNSTIRLKNTENLNIS